MRKIKNVMQIGNVYIGGNNPVLFQSMTNIKTSNTKEVTQQINTLVANGTQIVRVAVLDQADAIAIKELKKATTCAIVADIHFDYKLALTAIESGCDKLRINPGNIGDIDKIKQVVDACKLHNIPIRIGVNSGSIDKEIEAEYGISGVALYQSALKHIKILESLDFYNICVSIKATSIDDLLAANKLLDQNHPYPIHIGLTEAGTNQAGIVRSSYAIGTLLSAGIGDTIRVSLTGDPVSEIPVCKDILAMFDLYDKPTLISCPTCGRLSYDMFSVVEEIEKYLNTLNKKIKVAIMGCAVNGPGEARDADIGIAGGKSEALLFIKGKIIKKVPQSEIVKTLIEEIEKLINN